MDNKTKIGSRESADCQVKAEAHANIALVKYWGKRSLEKNLAATGSISLTLDALKTETEIRIDSSFQKDYFELDGKPVSGEGLKRISDFLDIIVGTEERDRAYITSKNSFPTAAGLASSASGFAALTIAAAKVWNKPTDRSILSSLARRGSGSAARSIFGGFVEMKSGKDLSGSEDYAATLYGKDYWDLRVVIGITDATPKKIGSTEGMERSRKTAPYYDSWITSTEQDLEGMRDALAKRDFTQMGELAEHSALKMHGLAMSARPAILYWNAATLESIHKIRDLRKRGIEAYITIDAGPQIKVLCKPADIEDVQQALTSVTGLQKVITSGIGDDAKVTEVKK
ncbi:diphosphomevalonate decarboxylase [Aliifodinibius salicampi]|uniref:diphosphomevalonate decarboxylase n=1 Tax=Fodinibius salicampi TaxID=1920655 RepID=A0ABT3PXH9_9BACT|nr:diphosphomevalonate decarboxylase [Fodinibius salicampi]